MCSFLLTNIGQFVLAYVNYLLQRRGPDATNVIKHNDFTFVHNLLHMTGEKTLQPFIKDDIYCLFNGEIYNYKQFGDYPSDGFCIIDLYLKYGEHFPEYLDGEFAITLVDFKNNIILITTDIFGIKPVWYSVENNKIAISSYKSAIERLNFNNSIKLSPNSTLIINLTTLEIIKKIQIYQFDLRQYKNTYDDWIKAFDNAILKRAKNTIHPVFVCLSSGYDSGCICYALNKLEIPYNTYTIINKEDNEVLRKRIKINNVPIDTIILTEQDYQQHQKSIKLLAEPLIYKKYKNDEGRQFYKDDATIGLSYIFDIASKRQQKVYLSGQGADEIISDYGVNGKKIYKHSCFGGKFPNDLNTIFPKNGDDENAKWYSFYKGTQESYIGKEEHISGMYGIEGRYPFLDKDVVQEFLWLTPELKNKMYKAPIDAYLTNYPIDKDVKIGFSWN